MNVQALINLTHFFCCPLETCHYTVLYLIQILNSLCDIHKDVGPCAIWSKAPNLTGLAHFPLIFLSQVASSLFELLPRGHVTFIDVLGQAIWERPGFHVQTIVLVGRLGQANLV